MGPRGFKVTDEHKAVDVQKGRQAEKCQKVQTKVFQNTSLLQNERII